MIETLLQWDTSFVHAAQALGPSWLPVAQLLSDIIGAKIYLVPAVVLALFAINKRRTAFETIIVFVVAAAVTYLLKDLIGAPRPYWVDSAVYGYAVENDNGMPSGHALISFAVLGWLWLRHPRSLSLSLGIGTIIVLVGLSRVYLGVHYPSQILAGWAIAALILLILTIVDRTYFRRRDRFVRLSHKLR